MKVAPVMAAMGQRAELFQQWLVHTGQHYDYEMSQVFFEELQMPAPDEYLELRLRHACRADGAGDAGF